jgi:hypothetical protein
MAEPGVSLAAVRLRSDDQNHTTLGRPWISASAGVGWHF